MSSPKDSALSPRGLGGAVQIGVVTLLRIAVGWHFLYEGLSKLYTPHWTSAGFLKTAQGPLAGTFEWIAENPDALRVADLLNMWGLTVLGAALVLGLFTRLSCVLGILLLASYYLAHPPWFAADPNAVREGHYLLVNKNVVELLALVVVAVVPAGRWLGVDRLFMARRRRRQLEKAEPDEEELEEAVERDPLGRRAVLASLTGLPFLGGFVFAVMKKHGWGSQEEEKLAARVDAVTGATIKTFDFSTLEDLQAPVPHAKIGTMDLSRLILGGNLIGGWAHARDLIYVSKLVKAYHHREKIFETFLLAEQCGVNAILTNPVLCDVINDYWRRQIGTIQFISDCGGKDVLKMVQKSIDGGAAACYIQGGVADRLVRRERFDLIGKALDLIRRNDLPAGIGGHRLATIQRCVEHGLVPDFWMKTLHQHNYWSAQPEKRCDNLWCEHPEETAAFMATREEPWIAFKALAAGAIHPQKGFRYAFQHGADFLCVGMYDFQVVEDTNIALAALAENQERERPWRA